MLIQPKKPNLEHCCEAMFEGDTENRETRRRKAQTQMGNRETQRRRGRLTTERKIWEVSIRIPLVKVMSRQKGVCHVMVLGMYMKGGTMTL